MAEENEEIITPKTKKVKKEAEPSEVEMNSPKSKKKKKQEEPSEDEVIPSKVKSSKKKENLEKTIISPKTKKVLKGEEPSEETGPPKPKKMKKEKEVNGDIGEASTKVKNGLPRAEADSNASEESSSEPEKVKLLCGRWACSLSNSC